jgi:hypothetical protein
MLNNIKNISLIAALLVSSSAMASVTTTSGHFGGVSDTGNNFNQFEVNFGGVDVKVSGWSDTAGNTASNSEDFDPTIERAVDFDKNGYGWSMENTDEMNSRNCGYSHSADNLGADCNYQDYDFFLLEFSEAVTLNSATYSWRYRDNNGRSYTETKSEATASNQVSVAALRSGSLDQSTWQDVKDNQTIASNWSQMRYSGTDKQAYYTNFGQTGSGNASNLANTSSNFWLIGALNAAVFGGKTSWEGNDGMKLSHIKFTRNSTLAATSVPEPSSIALFGLAIVGLFASSRKKLK